MVVAELAPAVPRVSKAATETRTREQGERQTMQPPNSASRSVGRPEQRLKGDRAGSICSRTE